MNTVLAGQRVIIAGGGIGGAACALALAQRGAAVELYEKQPEFKEVGAGIQIGPHGLKLLDSFGLLQRVNEAGYQPRYMEWRDALNAQPLLKIDFDDDFRQHFGAGYLVIHRSDLLSILLDAAREAGAKLHTGAKVVGAVNNDDGTAVDIQVEWRDGHAPSSHTADMFIAADGIHSVHRKNFVVDEEIPSAYVAYRGTSPIAGDAGAADIEGVVGYIGPHCHFVQYPLRGGELLNQVAVFESPRYLEGLRTGDVPEDWGNNDEFRSAFNHTHDYIQGRLGTMWLDTWWQMSDRNPLMTWANNRIILIGDAAHPPLQYLASGAVMAIEDAAAIALYAQEAVQAGNLDWARVLKEVEAERAPRAKRIVEAGRFWGELWHLDDGMPRLVRNQLFRSAAADWHKYADWLWKYRVEDRAYLKNPEMGDLPKAISDWRYHLTQALTTS